MGMMAVIARVVAFVLVGLLAHAISVVGVTLSVTNTNPLAPAAPLLVAWQDLPQPSPQDWIGVYSPAASPDSHWIGWLNLTSASDSWHTGSGTLNITMRDLRSDLQFRLFKAPPDAPPPAEPHTLPVPLSSPEAVSGVVTFAGAGRPQQLHLALTSAASEMRIMWTTAALWPGSEVQYGRSSHMLTERAPAQWATYSQDQMCEAPANTTQGWRDPGYIYDAVMTHLSGGTTYFYRVGSVAGGWSEVFHFVTQPEEPAETYALVYGDMGVDAPYDSYDRLQPEAATTLRLLQRDIEALGDRPLVVSHIGDITYARGHAWLWDEFMAAIEPVARHVPYHVAIGNHEYNWPAQPFNPEWAHYGHDSGGECGVPYSTRFHMAGSASVPTGTAAPATRNVWYSVDVGTVHFTYISTEHDFTPGSPQLTWLEADLAGVDRQRTPFVVLSGHRPMYTSNDEERDRGKRAALVAYVEPLLVAHHVSLCLWGHVHKFERTCPLANHTCHASQQGTVPPPVHAVVGMAGQDWQPPWAPLYGFIYPIPEWSLFRQDGYGYCRLQADRHTLTLTYITNHDGRAHDYVEILSPAAYLAGNEQRPRPMQLWADAPASTHAAGQWVEHLVVGASVSLAAVFVVAWVAHWLRRARGQPKAASPGEGAWDQVATTEEEVP